MFKKAHQSIKCIYSQWILWMIDGYDNAQQLEYYPKDEAELSKYNFKGYKE